MKKIIPLAILFLLLGAQNLVSAENRSLLEKILNRDLPGGAASKAKKNKIKELKKEKEKSTQEVYIECEHIDDKSLLEKVIRRDLPGGSGKKKECIRSAKKRQKKDPSYLNITDTDVSLYTGTFDVIDKEGDDQTSLLGIEHKNSNLFRDTLFGRVKPVSGAFVTGDSSFYLYSGIEAQYDIGPLKILPSFTPGYYEKGDGKDLGSALEFKSEIKIGFDIFENSKLGYSYSHISNNDWGDTNPGTDNQQITFTKNF